MHRLMTRVALGLFLAVGCSAGSEAVVVADDPVELAVEKNPANREGAAIWRKACRRIHKSELADLQKRIDKGDKKAQVEADDVMLSCMEGFMAMPDAASNMAAECILKAESQEEVFRCLQKAIHHQPELDEVEK